MKTREDAVRMGNQIKGLCIDLFKGFGNGNYSIEDNGGACGDGYSVVFPWCVVDLGWMVDNPTLTGNEQAPGFRVWTCAMKSGSHWEPDYLDDVTLCETLTWGTAVQAVLHEYVDWRWGIVCEENYADDIQREEV